MVDHRFTQTDIHRIAPAMLDAILSEIESAGSAKKIAENDHLMKCASFSRYYHTIRITVLM